MISDSRKDSDSTYDVYVVDDDTTIIELIVEILTIKGIRVKGMTSGFDLVDLIKVKPPRLVLLDVMMPILTGYAIFASIKHLAEIHHFPVYFISALPESNLAWYTRTNGAAGYIKKPFTMATLDTVLASAGIPVQA